VHSPRAIGDTLVLVLWPEGVRVVGDGTKAPLKN
jgi:hypothetical protein